jgi:hypothetical protein
MSKQRRKKKINRNGTRKNLEENKTRKNKRVKIRYETRQNKKINKNGKKEIKELSNKEWNEINT